MVKARRLVVAGALVALLEGLIGVLALFSLGPVEIALYPVACAAATAGVTVVAALAIRRAEGRGDGGPRDPGGGLPPWWPEFERDFRRHVRQRERTPV